MDTDIFISAAIVTYNDRERVLKACRSLLENTRRYPLKLYIIDNASEDDTLSALEELDGIEVLPQSKNLGFGAAHNKVLGEKMGKYHFVINPDIIINSDILSDMADFMEQNPDISMAIPKILNPDGTEQKLCREIPTAKRLFLGRLAKFGGMFKRVRDEYTWADRDITEVCELDFCTGCFFVMRSEVFCTLSGFDERFFMYLEDADITLRAQKYGKTVIAPQFEAVHEWHRASAKSPKYFFIHLSSCIKFLTKKRRNNK